eukprot:PITA_17475
MEIDSLLIASDLNCTLSNDEVWGRGRKNDPVGGIIREAILQYNFVDICPSKLAPIWDNGRSENAYLAKIIDRFLIHDRLMDHLGLPSSNILPYFISNHRPISLQWIVQSHRKGFPFKFNRIWLEDDAFNKIVQDSWLSSSPRAHPLMLNPYCAAWITGRLIDNKISLDLRARIRELERSKHNLLAIEEATWRLKSKAIWLKEGDKNAKFFHRYTNKRRETNSIWEIKDEEGNLLQT